LQQDDLNSFMVITKNKFGLLHSVDDKPSLIDDEGNKYWHKDGKFHLKQVFLENSGKYARRTTGKYEFPADPMLENNYFIVK
jgi:hypothetical protein